MYSDCTVIELLETLYVIPTPAHVFCEKKPRVPNCCEPA